MALFRLTLLSATPAPYPPSPPIPLLHVSYAHVPGYRSAYRRVASLRPAQHHESLGGAAARVGNVRSQLKCPYHCSG
ncbi:hypothetical protein PanWU01x14_167870 [Parasponia andersonii]|uniref:Uncharacterized protein n=1 Tax=Parasponia andersonii TaxID=3476 RepID=A0A2P5CAW9_PARAD|nr:hypothetical protein PanWU01x14_167870 [Parasponia andersonii]